MEALWQRLMRWAADCPLGITLNPGATEADIAAAEAALGLAFPADLREYLTLADGERDCDQLLSLLKKGRERRASQNTQHVKYLGALLVALN